MIVRILEDRQYELDEDARTRLNALDHSLDEALTNSDERAFDAALTALINEVRRSGKPVDPTTIVPSDLALPPEGSTIAEVRELLASESIEL